MMTNHYPNEQDAQARVRERESRAMASTDNLVRFLKTQKGQRQAGDALGCSGSSISGWLKDGAVPLTIDLACQYLLSRGTTVLRVMCPDVEVATKVIGVLDLLDHLGIVYTQEPR